MNTQKAHLQIRLLENLDPKRGICVFSASQILTLSCLKLLVSLGTDWVILIYEDDFLDTCM